MSLLKFENRTPRSLEDMCAYMCDPNKTDSRGVFGIGVNPLNAANEMRLVQNYYHHRNIKHEYVQVIFCFDSGTRADIGLIREVCERIGHVLITDKRQVLGAIHYLDTDKPHCHYLINYVGIDGSLYQQKFHVNHYKGLVNEILAEYGCFQPIKFCENESKEVLAVQKKEVRCPWTIDKRFLQQPTQDTADSVAQFRDEHPKIQMKSPVVTYSDENVKNIRDCSVRAYSAQPMVYSPATPYVYSQSGQEMLCLYPASENYLRPPQVLPTPKLPPSTKPQDFVYDESVGTLFWIHRNKNSTERYRLANFYVAVEKIYTLVDTNAQEERITMLIKNNHYEVHLDIRLSKLNSLMQELATQYPQFRLFCDLARANSIFQQYVSEIYELSHGILPHEMVYKNAGWQRNFNGWHYYSGNDANCLSEFRLAVMEHAPFTLIDWVSGLLEIADMKIMLPLLLHAHLGYTLKLFEDAGYNEQFILALIGSSGSKKTSLARVLFSLFGDALINFTSTNRGIELDLMRRQDSALIMDDLSSGCDKVLAAKFEKILRQLGDSTGRRRSINGGNELDRVPTRCAVVLTAETDIDALSKSSKLRTLAVFINHDSIDSAKLRAFQDDDLDAKMSGRFSKLEQYMTLYVNFLEAHYSACVEHLKKIRRNEFGDCSFARQATIFKMLLGQAELILLFWEVCGMFQGKESVDLHARWTDVLGKVMTINERRGKEAEPYILFLQVVEQATHTIDIARRKDEAFNCRLGFFDYHNISLNLCLYPNAVYDYVVAYCSRYGKMFTESPQSLWNKLYELDLIEVYNQRNRKPKLFQKRTVGYQQVSCLVLKWSVVKALLDNLTPEITLSNGGKSNEH